MVVVADRYTEKIRRILDTLRRLGFDIVVWILQDDGFLPDGILSPYRYVIAQQGYCAGKRKELFYAFLDIPQFWEIRADGNLGAVYDMGVKKASVFFADPVEKRNVQRVEWCTANGWKYRTDYYDKYGRKYKSEFADVSGKVESSVFYTDKNQEIIVEQLQSDTVTLLENGTVSAFFYSYAQFIRYGVDQVNPSGKRVLVVQGEEQLSLLESREMGSDMWDCVLFTDSALLERYVSMGGRNGYRFYDDPPYYPANQAKGEVLILTASDQIEEIEHITKELPEIIFNIAANTQVSEKLNRLADQVNVKVYPQISQQNLDGLWDICDFYLDINHYHEIFGAVESAHQKNLLILGFKDTLHNKELITEECILRPGDSGGLIQMMKMLTGDSKRVQELLAKQQNRKAECWKKIRGLMEERI